MIQHQISNSLGNYNYNANIYNNAIFSHHFHANYELIYVSSGSADITVNNLQETLFPGEMLLIPPYTVHSLLISGSKTWVGVFSDDFIPAYSEKYMYTKHSKFRCSAEVEKFLNNNLFFQGCPERYMHISCLYMACNECIKNAETIQGNEYSDFISDTIKFISKNINNDIRMEDLAASMNYEYHYFSSLFNQLFATNFKSFINYYRFNMACSMISDKKNSITYISEYCGFGSIRNFNRVFKKLSGYTPSEFRKSNNQGRHALSLPHKTSVNEKET